MPERGRMTRIVRRQYGDPEKAIPSLLLRHGSPHLVAKAISAECGEAVTANAVRVWLKKRGWQLQRSEWHSPAADPTPGIEAGVAEGSR